MLKLIIGNRAYSSWSMRGWLAVQAIGRGVRGTGRADVRRGMGASAARATSSRRRSARCRSCGTASASSGTAWRSSSSSPTGSAASASGRRMRKRRGMARSMAAEMHSELRQPAPRAADERPHELSAGRAVATRSATRSTGSCSCGRRPARGIGGGGDFLFGTWCAADIMFAPVVTRFITYGVPVPPFAAPLHEGGAVPPARQRLDRQGAGRALGDRAI